MKIFDNFTIGLILFIAFLGYLLLIVAPKYTCELYEEATGNEVKFVELSGCYVKHKDKWLSKREFDFRDK